MSADDALLRVFVDEAVRCLSVLEDAGATIAARDEAIDSLDQLVELLGDDDLSHIARRAIETIRRPEGREAGPLVDVTRRIRHRLAASKPDSTDEVPRDGAAERATPDDAFDSDEYDVLRTFFRDEAGQLLDSVAQTLLAAGSGGLEPADYDDVLRATHSLKGSAGTIGLTGFADAAHRLEDAFDRARRGQPEWTTALADSFVEIVDGMREYAMALGDARRERALLRRLGERIKTIAGSRPDQTRAVSPSLDAEARAAEDRRLSDRRREDQPLLRVDPERVDRLMDGVGELVFDRTRIQRRVRELTSLADSLSATRRALHDHVSDSDDSALGAIEMQLAEQAALIQRSTASLAEDVEALRRTATALQDGLTSVRMQTSQTLFQMLAPQLRSMARAAGKRIQLVTVGGETEFDRAVAEQITDPMVQLLRNAVAHGIEPGDVRRRRGKTADGHITLTARHDGGRVVLEVSDDGAGLEPAKLRERFVSSGRWPAARAELARDDEVLAAIFEPGMSTRDEADHLAGRGVGLDAVRETIARLGGEVQVRSTPGRGTTFSLFLPLTTAMSHALLFEVGGNVYAVPNVHVVDSVSVHLDSDALSEAVEVSGARVPLVPLHEQLGTTIPDNAAQIAALVIEYLGRRLAITCDRIIGPREIVLKRLGPLLAPLPLYAGGTISGAGKVQLILDPAALVRIAYPGAQPTLPASRRPSDTTPPKPTLAGRILIADDSRSMHDALSRMLERAGYIADVAGDGEAAWEIMQQQSYDVLVTDLEMPGMGGFELIERIRADDSLRAIPVIVISSNASDANRKRANSLGVHTFIAKPITRGQLIGALERSVASGRAG